MRHPTASPSRLEVVGARAEGFDEILSPPALAFVERLQTEFGARRDELLRRRAERQREIDAGSPLDFLSSTGAVRAGDWTVAEIPPDLRDRRVEITGPVDRKMVINALNSGANVFMADFEDANAPTWTNQVQGQINLRDAVDRAIEFTSPQGKRYVLNEETAVLLVRPRGWHLVEKHVLADGQPVSGALFDFGLYLFHNARRLLERGTGPYFYLPKLQSHLEARLWNDVFCLAQDELGVPRGSIRATVLLETLPAAFEMDEILYELRDHSAGLNCGRWDYIFSLIKTLREDPRYLLPDRAQVTMTTRCMRSYSRLAIQTCHRRGIHAIGGMAAQIPIRSDPVANEEALAKVREDKVREASDGHDGTWVAHPGLVAIAKAAFDERMPDAHQIAMTRDDVEVTVEDLLAVPQGTITEEGVRHNIDVGMQYMAAWLGGNGCVPIYNLMEDAATAEISRSQLWQWLHHRDAALSDGRAIDRALVRSMFDEEARRLLENVGGDAAAADRARLARGIIEDIVSEDEFTEFMTLVGYDHLE